MFLRHDLRLRADYFTNPPNAAPRAFDVVARASSRRRVARVQVKAPPEPSEGAAGAELEKFVGLLAAAGVDIEKRIAQVYQECLTAEEIQTAFNTLQAELDDKISQAMVETRRSPLENFDEEVHARLQLHRDDALSALSRRNQWLLAMTRFELDGQATFETRHPRFKVHAGWRDLVESFANRNGKIVTEEFFQENT